MPRGAAKSARPRGGTPAPSRNTAPGSTTGRLVAPAHGPPPTHASRRWRGRRPRCHSGTLPEAHLPALAVAHAFVTVVPSQKQSAAGRAPPRRLPVLPRETQPATADDEVHSKHLAQTQTMPGGATKRSADICERQSSVCQWDQIHASPSPELELLACIDTSASQSMGGYRSPSPRAHPMRPRLERCSTPDGMSEVGHHIKETIQCSKNLWVHVVSGIIRKRVSFSTATADLAGALRRVHRNPPALAQAVLLPARLHTSGCPLLWLSGTTQPIMIRVRCAPFLQPPAYCRSRCNRCERWPRRIA